MLSLLPLLLLLSLPLTSSFLSPPPFTPKYSPTSAPLLATGGAAAQTYDGVRIGPPPDLPSLLLHNRIVYIGMPLSPSVTELIIAQLLYLNYESSDKPIYMYINSPGTINAQGQPVGFETEGELRQHVRRETRDERRETRDERRETLRGRKRGY